MTSVRRTWRFRQPVERVWRALTDRDELASWLLPNDFAPRVGHRFTLRGGTAFGLAPVVHCEVLELDRPRRLVLGWSERPGPTETVVELELRSTGDGTELRIEHRVRIDATVRAGPQPRPWDWTDETRRALGATLERVHDVPRGEVTP